MATESKKFWSHNLISHMIQLMWMGMKIFSQYYRKPGAWR